MDISPANSALQPSWMPNLPPTEVIIPKKLPHTVRTISIIILALGIGVLGWWFFIGSKHEGDSRLGSLRVGDYNYLAACSVFTANDFKAATGQAADQAQTIALYTTATDNQAAPDRSYRSECTRAEPGVGAGALTINVVMWQYPRRAVMDEPRTLLHLSGATTNAALGGPTDYLAPTLTFETGNKIIRVTTTGTEGLPDAEVQQLAIAVGKKVRQRMTEQATKPSSVLAYPAQLSGKAVTYHAACALWGVNDFEKLYEPADKTSVRATYAEAITPDRWALPVDSECRLDSYTADPANTAAQMHASLNVTYYPTVAIAAEEYRTTLNDATDVSGLGDTAAFTFSNGTVGAMKVLHGQTLVQLHVILRQGSGATEAVALNKLQTMATTTLDRLK